MLAVAIDVNLAYSILRVEAMILIEDWRYKTVAVAIFVNLA